MVRAVSSHDVSGSVTILQLVFYLSVSSRGCRGLTRSFRNLHTPAAVPCREHHPLTCSRQPRRPQHVHITCQTQTRRQSKASLLLVDAGGAAAAGEVAELQRRPDGDVKASAHGRKRGAPRLDGAHARVVERQHHGIPAGYIYG